MANIDQKIRIVYLLASGINILGMLAVSKLFTNEYLTSLYPSWFSIPSIIMIMLWGSAYAIVAFDYRRYRWFHLLFAIEKFVYFLGWLAWMCQFHLLLPSIANQDLMAAAFFASFGLNDLGFAVVFFLVFIKMRNDQGSVP